MNTKLKTGRMATLTGWTGLGGGVALAFAGAAQISAQTAVSVASAAGFPGAAVSLPVSLRRATNVTAAQFDVAYNPARVTAGAFVPGGVFSNHIVRTREVAPGVHRVLTFSRANAAVAVTNSTAAVELPFTVSPTEYVGSGPITPGNARLARPDATSVAPIALNSGTIFVRPVNPLPEGTQFFLPSEAGSNYVIQATTNLVEWTDVSTNTAFGDYLDLFDPFATNFPYRFYRWKREP